MRQKLLSAPAYIHKQQMENPSALGTKKKSWSEGQRDALRLLD